MKKFLMLSLVGILSVGLVCGCNKKEDDTKKDGDDIKEEQQPEVNVNPDVIGDKTLEEFTFTNTSLIYDPETNTTLLETTVTNTSDTTANLTQFLIHTKDNYGNDVTLAGFVGDSIAAGESKVISSSVSANLSKTAEMTYEVQR